MNLIPIKKELIREKQCKTIHTKYMFVNMTTVTFTKYVTAMGRDNSELNSGEIVTTKFNLLIIIPLMI